MFFFQASVGVEFFVLCFFFFLPSCSESVPLVEKVGLFAGSNYRVCLLETKCVHLVYAYVLPRATIYKYKIRLNNKIHPQFLDGSSLKTEITTTQRIIDCLPYCCTYCPKVDRVHPGSRRRAERVGYLDVAPAAHACGAAAALLLWCVLRGLPVL